MQTWRPPPPPPPPRRQKKKFFSIPIWALIKNGSANIRRRVGKTDEFVLCVFTLHVIWRIRWSTYFTVKLAVAKTAWQSTNYFQVCLPKCRLWIDNLSYHQSAPVHQGDAHMMKPRIFPSYEKKNSENYWNVTGRPRFGHASIMYRIGVTQFFRSYSHAVLRFNDEWLI